MKVIIAGSIDLEDPGQVKEMLQSARGHIEGALEEEGCIAYDWSEDHLIPGRIHVYEEWRSSDTLEATFRATGTATWARTSPATPAKRATPSSRNIAWNTKSPSMTIPALPGAISSPSPADSRRGGFERGLPNR